MTSIKRTFAIGAFTLSVAAFAMGNSLNSQANEPAYNPATNVDVVAVITGIRQAPAGSPLAGVHLNAKSKTAAYDIYLGPADFLRMLKADIRSGDEIEVSGSKVTLGGAEVILTREITDGRATIELRDASGQPNWNTWGVEAAPNAGD